MHALPVVSPAVLATCATCQQARLRASTAALPVQVTLSALDEGGGTGDMRINAARLLTELLMVYMSRNELYRCGGYGGGGGADGDGDDVTAPLDSLLHARVVPLLHRMMMSGCDPMPLYAQKVLATLLTRCDAASA